MYKINIDTKQDIRARISISVCDCILHRGKNYSLTTYSEPSVSFKIKLGKYNAYPNRFVALGIVHLATNSRIHKHVLACIATPVNLPKSSAFMSTSFSARRVL